jgi:hypothetical protein
MLFSMVFLFKNLTLYALTVQGFLFTKVMNHEFRSIRNTWNFSLREIDGKIILKESNRLMPASFEQIEEVRKALINTIEYYNDNFFDSKSLEIEEERQTKEYLISYKKMLSEKKVIRDDLYLIHDETFDTLKIGRSKNPKSRLTQLQCATSNTLNILYIINGCGNKEKELHKKYAGLRLASEWFVNDGSIIRFFKAGLVPF